MIVTLITIAILVFGIFCIFYTDCTSLSWPEDCAPVCITIGTIALCIELIILCVVNINPAGGLAAAEAHREVLVYQLENKTYENDVNLGATELFNDISKYNQGILRSRAGRKNLWVSWFYNSYSNELELIDLEDYK